MVETELTLEALHKQVQQRLGSVLFDQPSLHYEPLRVRYHQCALNPWPPGPQQRTELRADLAELLDTPVEVLRRMAFQQATSARCIGPDCGQAAIAALAQQNAMLPRVSPAELIQGFAARGIMVRGAGGALHVQPADRLTDADREVLLENKSGILAALSRPAVVL